MPEDGKIGFAAFETKDGVNIANEAAVRAVSVRLFNEAVRTARDVEHLYTAKHAVGAAALMKAGRDVDRSDDVDNNDFDDGSDFFL